MRFKKKPVHALFCCRCLLERYANCGQRLSRTAIATDETNPAADRFAAIVSKIECAFFLHSNNRAENNSKQKGINEGYNVQLAAGGKRPRESRDDTCNNVVKASLPERALDEPAAALNALFRRQDSAPTQQTPRNAVASRENGGIAHFFC